MRRSRWLDSRGQQQQRQKPNRRTAYDYPSLERAALYRPSLVCLPFAYRMLTSPRRAASLYSWHRKGSRGHELTLKSPRPHAL